MAECTSLLIKVLFCHTLKNSFKRAQVYLEALTSGAPERSITDAVRYSIFLSGMGPPLPLQTVGKKIPSVGNCDKGQCDFEIHLKCDCCFPVSIQKPSSVFELGF